MSCVPDRWSVREDLGGGAGRDGAVEPEIQLCLVSAGRDPLPLPLLLRRGEVPGVLWISALHASAVALGFRYSEL